MNSKIQKRHIIMITLVIATISFVTLFIAFSPTANQDIQAKIEAPQTESPQNMLNSVPSKLQQSATEDPTLQSPDPVETGHEELQFIESEVLEQAGGAVETALYMDKLKDPGYFVKVSWGDGIPYEECRRQISEDKLPILYEMLKNPEYGPYWGRVAQIIGFISRDPNSIPVLLDYIQRDDEDSWNWRVAPRKNGYRLIMGKILCLEWIGIIGGDQAETVLQKAIIEAGSTEFARSWLESELTRVGKKGGSKAVIELMRGRAAIGLVYTQKPENLKLVKEYYQEEHDKHKAAGTWSDFYNCLCDAMAVHDLINDNDLERRYELWGSGREPSVLHPYITKYNWIAQARASKNSTIEN